jgi:peptidyl-prolyl cis-trans isomerase A (cyclophilin A)
VTEIIEILIETEFGGITLELYPKLAPLTVANFLQYVDENRYSGACFYRVVHIDNQPNNDVKIEVIQGGLKEDDHPDGLSPISHETTEKTGIRHKHGTISMARNEPGTASSEFFICINDQPELDFGGRRNPDGQGFAAFGKVSEGMDVVVNIQSQPVEGQYLIKDIRVKNIRRIDISAHKPA